MFTGIVEELGTMISRDGDRVRFGATTVLDDVHLGDSIAVCGCCLTVVDFDQSAGWWDADVSAETWARTSLGSLTPGDPINLERAVRVSDRLGGHLVQGHVDGVGKVIVAAPDLEVELPADGMRYVVEKGSITIDGISLTVCDVAETSCTFAIIPHTMAVTTLGARKSGDPVNVEFDVMAKYVDRLSSPYLAAMRENPDGLDTPDVDALTTEDPQ